MSELYLKNCVVQPDSGADLREVDRRRSRPLTTSQTILRIYPPRPKTPQNTSQTFPRASRAQVAGAVRFRPPHLEGRLILGARVWNTGAPVPVRSCRKSCEKCA